MAGTSVLFICIGNSCRSQMAEGFALKYGSDILQAASAGLAPAPIVQPMTIQTMARKNIDITAQFPKSVYELDLSAYDILVNMSGANLPVQGLASRILVWEVADPMLQPDEVYLRVCDQIEGLVMQLIMELRRRSKVIEPIDAPVVSRLQPVSTPKVEAQPPTSLTASTRAATQKMERPALRSKPNPPTKKLPPTPSAASSAKTPARTGESERFGFSRRRPNRD